MNVSSELSGLRLKALCELEGISRANLADQLGMPASKLSKIENGSQRFPADLATHLGARFGYPLEFFVVQDQLLEGVVPTFRKTSRARALAERQTVRLAKEAGRVFRDASATTDYRGFEFPRDPDLLDDVEFCATLLRRMAGLGPTDPVPHVTRLLERMGVGVVLALQPGRTAKNEHSGLTLPTRLNERPLVAIAHPLAGAITRFTLAHELAHLIWDQDLRQPLTSTRDARELRAHDFAGALLLPRPVAIERVHEGTTLRGLLPIKADYGLSVGAIIIRARNLGIITPERARSLQIQLSSLGWRDADVEPVEVMSEKPLLLKQALSRVTDMSALALARHTGLKPELVRFWLGLSNPSDADSDDELAPHENVVSFNERRARLKARAERQATPERTPR